MGVILLATLVKLCYCLTTTLDNTNVAMDIINSNTTTDNRDIINWLATVDLHRTQLIPRTCHPVQMCS